MSALKAALVGGALVGVGVLIARLLRDDAPQIAPPFALPAFLRPPPPPQPQLRVGSEGGERTLLSARRLAAMVAEAETVEREAARERRLLATEIAQRLTSARPKKPPPREMLTLAEAFARDEAVPGDDDVDPTAVELGGLEDPN